MGLNRPTQVLKSDLRAMAADMKWMAVDLVRITERLSASGNEADAQALLRMMLKLGGAEERLDEYAEEVKAGRISREKG